jgi:uncharacterized OsmC-like protein
MNSASVDRKQAGLDQSPHPLAFVAATGSDGARPEGLRPEASFRCEVMGIGRFQKEGLVEDLATGRVWRLAADEGKYLRGTGLAPAPLMHWAAGLHGDVTHRIARLAAAQQIAISDLEVTVSQGFASEGSFARGEAVALVFDLEWEIRVATGAPLPQIASLVDRALRFSPLNAAMVTGKEGKFALNINGRTSPVSGVPQSRTPAEADPFKRYSSRPAPVDGDHATSTVLTSGPLRTASTVTLGDDQSKAIGWHVEATGKYEFESGIVTATVGFPEIAASEQWWLRTDHTNRYAPSPMSYFSLGTAFCYHTQLCRYIDVRRMDIRSPRLAQMSHFSNGEAAVAQPFDTHLFLNGVIDADQATSLLLAAANTCYAHRALSVDINTNHTLRVGPMASGDGMTSKDQVPES